MKKNELAISLPESIGTELTTIQGNLMEIGVDSLLNDGVLKDIPIVSSVLGIVKTGVAVKDHLYVKKLLRFLNAFQKLDETKRLNFVSNELSNESDKERFGEVMLNLIDKSDDSRKFPLYANAFKLHFNDECTYEDSLRMCTMIERTFYSDLEWINGFEDGSFNNELSSSELYKSGFLNFSGVDGGEIGNHDSGGVIYSLNKYGFHLRKVMENST